MTSFFYRQSDQGVEITRILERCIKESRCVDTESLCIMAGVKVSFNVFCLTFLKDLCTIRLMQNSTLLTDIYK